MMTQTPLEAELGRVARTIRQARPALGAVSVSVNVRQRKGADSAAVEAVAQLCATAPATIGFLCDALGVVDAPPAQTERGRRLQVMAVHHRDQARELLGLARWLDRCAQHLDQSTEGVA